MTYEQGRKPAALFQSTECLRCQKTIQAGAVNWVHIKMGPLKGRKQHRDCQQADDWLGWLPATATQPTQFGSKLTAALDKQATQEPVQVSGDLAQLLASAISPYIVATDSKVESKLKDFENTITQLLSDIEDSVNAKLNMPSTSIEVRHVETQEVVRLENVHPRFEKLLKLCMARKKVYIYGPAGSGKSTAAEQVAESLKLSYYTISLNRQSTPSLVLGYMDALGKYQTTAYRQAWEHGGVLLIDEFDNASGNLLTTLNTGLANGHMSFPDSPNAIARHTDCIIITAGNTCLRGADRQYNERQQLDAATIDRFVFLEWNYDEAFERKLALQRNPDADSWISYVQRVRSNCTRLNIRVAITPRASLEGADLLLAGFTQAECVEMLLRKGLDQDTWNKIK